MLVLDIISFVSFLIVLFLMWRKVKKMDENIQKDFKYVACELSKLSLSRDLMQNNLYHLEGNVQDLRKELIKKFEECVKENHEVTTQIGTMMREIGHVRAHTRDNREYIDARLGKLKSPRRGNFWYDWEPTPAITITESIETLSTRIDQMIKALDLQFVPESTEPAKFVKKTKSGAK